MAGCILVGGQSRRLGRSKALLRLNGRTLLEHVILALSQVYSEDRLLLVAARPEEVAWVGLQCVNIAAQDKGPLAALIEALRHSPDQHNLVVACDLPFLSPEVLALLLARLPGQLAVIPEIGGYLEPLCAAYSQAALPLLEDQFQQGVFGLQTAASRLSPLLLPEQTIRLFDPFLRSFFHINTAEDLARARKLAARL
jgi:molybdopterin-guanine dinucleotide biosynthesis protein A